MYSTTARYFRPGRKFRNVADRHGPAWVMNSTELCRIGVGIWVVRLPTSASILPVFTSQKQTDGTTWRRLPYHSHMLYFWSPATCQQWLSELACKPRLHTRSGKMTSCLPSFKVCSPTKAGGHLCEDSTWPMKKSTRKTSKTKSQINVPAFSDQTAEDDRFCCLRGLPTMCASFESWT